VYLAQKINIYLAEHWKSFASRNYFDRAGVFISVVWSGPLIFISIVSVVSKIPYMSLSKILLICDAVLFTFQTILIIPG
jgi:hypothetical protein